MAMKAWALWVLLLVVVVIVVAAAVVVFARPPMVERLEAPDCQKQGKLLLVQGGSNPTTVCVARDVCTNAVKGIDVGGRCMCDSTRLWNGSDCALPTPRPAPEEARVLEGLRQRATQVISHVRTSRANDPRTRMLLERVKRVELLSPEESKPNADGSFKNGKFSYGNGTVYVRARDTKGVIRTWPSLCMTLLHELAHAGRKKEPNETSHSKGWNDTWVWLLSIATQELGWVVEVKCSDCGFYGLCDRPTCPRCEWKNTRCGSLKPIP